MISTEMISFAPLFAATSIKPSVSIHDPPFATVELMVVENVRVGVMVRES